MNNIKTLLIYFGLFLVGSNLFAQNQTVPLNYYPHVEYNVKVAAHNTFANGTTFDKIVIDGFDSRIPFYFIKPKNNASNKYIILLHGITGSKDNWINATSSLSKKYVKLKDSLLTIGYNVIIPDAKYHGERSYEADFASPVTFYAKQDIQKIENLWSTTVKDIRIIMDYIQSSTNEKGLAFDVVGYSMGGLMAIYLNTVDKRLNHIVACVPPIGDIYKLSKRLGLKEENAKNLEPFSSEKFAPLQKSSISLHVGTKDGWYTKEEAQDFYDKIEIEAKSLKFYESGHYLPEEFISNAIESLTKK